MCGRVEEEMSEHRARAVQRSCEARCISRASGQMRALGVRGLKRSALGQHRAEIPRLVRRAAKKKAHHLLHTAYKKVDVYTFAK